MTKLFQIKRKVIRHNQSVDGGRNGRKRVRELEGRKEEDEGSGKRLNLRTKDCVLCDIWNGNW